MNVFVNFGRVNIDLDNRNNEWQTVSALHGTRSEKRVPTATNRSQCFSARARPFWCRACPACPYIGGHAGQTRPGTSGNRIPARPGVSASSASCLFAHRPPCTPPPRYRKRPLGLLPCVRLPGLMLRRRRPFGKFRLFGDNRFVVRHLGRNIFGNIHQHRAAAPFLGQIETLPAGYRPAG